jgi:hypothetical protein
LDDYNTTTQIPVERREYVIEESERQTIFETMRCDPEFAKSIDEPTTPDFRYKSLM